MKFYKNRKIIQKKIKKNAKFLNYFLDDYFL